VRKRNGKEFAVAATITSVSRPHFEVKTDASQIAQETVTLFLGVPKNVYIVRGQCLDLAPLSPMQLDSTLLQPSPNDKNIDDLKQQLQQELQRLKNTTR
jgi:hypothetical protein